MVRTQVENETLEVIDEIAEYIDLRSVGSSEAAWHLFNFNISKKYPAVYALRVHLEHEQSVVFDFLTQLEEFMLLIQQQEMFISLEFCFIMIIVRESPALMN